jgi:hypothetical protein
MKTLKKSLRFLAAFWITASMFSCDKPEETAAPTGVSDGLEIFRSPSNRSYVQFGLEFEKWAHKLTNLELPGKDKIFLNI